MSYVKTLTISFALVFIFDICTGHSFAAATAIALLSAVVLTLGQALTDKFLPIAEGDTV
jgi:hypothetical protein